MARVLPKRFKVNTDGSRTQVDSRTGKPLVPTTITTTPPAARGDDFATDFEASGGADIVRRTGGSIGGAIDVLGGRLSESDLRKAAQRNVSRAEKAQRNNLKKGNLTSTSATDASRASNLNTTLGESTVAEGPRSSTSRVLSDKEVEEYGARGFREGDFVPGEGVLLPDGSFNTAPLNQLTKIEEEALRIQEQLQRLDNQQTNDEFTGVASDESIVREEDNAIETLSKPDTIISGALDLLAQQEDIIQKQLDAEIKSANAQFKIDSAELTAKQASESGKTSVGLAAAGGYLGFSGSGTGVMLSLTKSHRAELQRLKLEREKAISTARQKAAQGELDAVRLQAQLVERLENEAYEREVEYQKQMKETSDKQAEEAKTKQNETDIYNLIQKGTKTPADIFNALGGAVPIADINKILTGFLPDSLKDGGFKFTATNTATLLGAGLAQDDILALNEYVNENGYDETVRNSLTPVQRAAADKIFRPIAGGTGTKPGTPMTILDLDRMEESYGVRFPFGTTQAQAIQFFEDNPGASPDELQAALDLTLTGGEKDIPVSIDVDFIKSSFTKTQQKRLADKVGASSFWTGKDKDIERMFNTPEYVEAINNLSEAELLEILGTGS